MSLKSALKMWNLPTAVLSVVGTGAFATKDTNAIVYRADSHCYCPVLNKEYVARYRNSDGQMVISDSPAGSGVWTDHIATTPVPAILDEHLVISIVTDGAGCVIVAWGMHSTPQNVWVGTTPGDCTVTAAGVQASPLVAGQATAEAAATYPVLRRLSVGDIIYLWRTGASGNGNQCVYRWNYVARTWVAVNMALMNGQSTRSAYLNTVWIDVCDRISMAWQWRDSLAVSDAFDCNMLYTDDGFQSTHSMDGTLLPGSITSTNAPTALAQIIPKSPTAIYQAAQGFCCDAGRRGIAINYYDDGGGAGLQLHATRYTGSGYVTTQFGTYPAGALGISRPTAWFYKGVTYVFYSLTDSLGVEGTWCVYSRNTDLSDVQQFRLDLTPTKDSSVCASFTHWLYLGKLVFFNMRTGLSGPTPSNGPNLLTVSLIP